MPLANTLAPVAPASPQHAQVIAAVQKRIDSALASSPTGPKGFLIWVKAAFPGPIADKVLSAARAHQIATRNAAAQGPIALQSNAAKAGVGGFSGLARYEGRTTYGAYGAISPEPTRGSRLLTFNGRQRRQGIGAVPVPLHPSGYDFQSGRRARAGIVSFDRRQRRFGLNGLGDATTDALGSDALANFTVGVSSDPTIANASTSSASPSWLSSIGSAVTAATQAYLGLQQSKDAQTLFDTNLQRAQQGLAPLNANPTAYGIMAPSVNVGLSPGVQSLLMYGGIGLGLILLLNVGLKAAKK